MHAYSAFESTKDAVSSQHTFMQMSSMRTLFHAIVDSKGLSSNNPTIQPSMWTRCVFACTMWVIQSSANQRAATFGDSGDSLVTPNRNARISIWTIRENWSAVIYIPHAFACVMCEWMLTLGKACPVTMLYSIHPRVTPTQRQREDRRTFITLTSMHHYNVCYECCAYSWKNTYVQLTYCFFLQSLAGHIAGQTSGMKTEHELKSDIFAIFHHSILHDCKPPDSHSIHQLI